MAGCLCVFPADFPGPEVKDRQVVKVYDFGSVPVVLQAVCWLRFLNIAVNELLDSREGLR